MVGEMLKATRKWLPKYRTEFDSKNKVKSLKIEDFSSFEERKEKLFEEFNIIDKYYIIGPFDNRSSERRSSGLTISNPPEQEIDLSASYKGRAKKVVKWKRITRKDIDNDGLVSFVKFYGFDKFTVVYALAVLEAAQECRIKLLTSSYYGMTLWLNGKQILNKEGEQNIVRDRYAVDLLLKQGRNELLIKVDNKDSVPGFYARFEEKPARVRII